MNWRRGIFRIWLVGSAVWIAATVGLSYRYVEEQRPWWLNDPIVHQLPPVPPGFELDNPPGSHTFDFTDPSGKQYTVNGPDGSTPERAFAILQRYLGAQNTAAQPDHNELWGTRNSGF